MLHLICWLLESSKAHFLLSLPLPIQLAGVHVDTHRGLLLERTVGVDLGIGGKGDEGDGPTVLDRTVVEGRRTAGKVQPTLFLSSTLHLEDLSKT